jgi:hypothetical protein
MFLVAVILVGQGFNIGGHLIFQKIVDSVATTGVIAAL